MSEKVNLLVDLTADRFNSTAASDALATMAALGTRLEDRQSADDLQAAWIGRYFGGTWPRESRAGRNWFASRDGALVGFCTYAATGFDFVWLANWRARSDVGIFGPVGVVPWARGCGLGAALTVLALHALRREGFAQALIPAVEPLAGAAFYARVSGAKIAERFIV